MIKYFTGDMLRADADALVNTVNTVGVMGKGIALQFKEAFPYNNKVYIQACKDKTLAPGRLLAVEDSNLLYGDKLIINFPTKIHWRQPSKYEYVMDGLLALRKMIETKGIKSIAIPPLGAGNGGLEWDKVKPMIVEALDGLPTEIQIYEPSVQIKEILQAQLVKKNVELTPSRTAVLYCLFAFESFGEYSSLFSANKLAYFLQRMGQKLKLDFKPYHYGPYAIGVEKVLYHMNGVYLKGMEQGEAKPFEPLKLNYEQWEAVSAYFKGMPVEDKGRVFQLIVFIKNFTSELSLEILSTVDYILAENPHASVDEVVQAISKWSLRKSELFKRDSVERAYHHLQRYKQELKLA